MWERWKVGRMLLALSLKFVLSYIAEHKAADDFALLDQTLRTDGNRQKNAFQRKICRQLGHDLNHTKLRRRLELKLASDNNP